MQYTITILWVARVSGGSLLSHVFASKPPVSSLDSSDWPDNNCLYCNHDTDHGVRIVSGDPLAHIAYAERFVHQQFLSLFSTICSHISMSQLIGEGESSDTAHVGWSLLMICEQNPAKRQPESTCSFKTIKRMDLLANHQKVLLDQLQASQVQSIYMEASQGVYTAKPLSKS